MESNNSIISEVRNLRAAQHGVLETISVVVGLCLFRHDTHYVHKSVQAAGTSDS